MAREVESEAQWKWPTPGWRGLVPRRPRSMISQERLGKVVRELRREAKLSQEELADRAGIANNRIRQDWDAVAD